MLRLRNFYKNIREKIVKSELSYYGKIFKSYHLSDEVEFAIKALKRMQETRMIVLDVGANRGDYSHYLVNKLNSDINIHCFEPSSDHLNRLSLLEKQYPGIVLIHQKALSSSIGNKELYKDHHGSSLASLYNRDLSCHGLVFDQKELISATTLDAWACDHGVEKISFLKLDVEGHELDVLQGGMNLLSEGRINAIQFEFGGCNIDSRIFVKDFHKLLVSKYSYSLYRLAPSKRLVDLNSYNESLECFMWQNLVALRTPRYIPVDYQVIYEK